ncbi:hypothetical protein PhCBS80983_g02140 [Powellomyces hirtus]|uniref:CDC20/Fizzy WD40 domain-containing protein n=1 Tax=Powellomyces hirtus TaxID=109895 RepID=A0A507E737_9FUNG|nr:hypothetical protein PhCBS80983_g02140 [Powellomyces hirtus]
MSAHTQKVEAADERVLESTSGTLMTSPCRSAAAHALRSPMRTQLVNMRNHESEVNEPEDAYAQLLHRELLDSPSKRNRLIFPSRSPRKMSRHQHCPSNPQYARSALSAASQSLVASPHKGTWEIPKAPYKILDAPDLQDDYYLNLIDWSSTDILGVGLGTCVYLWSAASSKVRILEAVMGTHLAIGTDSGLVQLWDIEKEKRVRQFQGHTKRVGTLSWNEEILSSGSRDKTIQHRDARARNGTVDTSDRHTAEVCGLKWDYDGNQLASGGNDNSLMIWDRRRMDVPTWMPPNPHQAAVKALTWSPHKTNMVASGGGTADRKIKIWNVQTQTLVKHMDTNSQVCNLAWGKQSEHLISTHGYSRNHITVWDQTETTLKEAATLTGHGSRVVYLAMSPDGQSIVTGAGDETLRFWKICNLKKSRAPGIDTSTCII